MEEWRWRLGRAGRRMAPRHHYTLSFYIVRRISFVGGVQVVGIPSTHWLMGEEGRMAEGTLYTADNAFLSIVRRFGIGVAVVSMVANFYPWLTFRWICGWDAVSREEGPPIWRGICCLLLVVLWLSLQYAHQHAYQSVLLPIRTRGVSTPPPLLIVSYFTPHTRNL